MDSTEEVDCLTAVMVGGQSVAQSGLDELANRSGIAEIIIPDGTTSNNNNGSTSNENQINNNGFLEVSEMLANALEQIDGIIAGSKPSEGDFDTATTTFSCFKDENNKENIYDVNGNSASAVVAEIMADSSSNESGLGQSGGDESPSADSPSSTVMTAKQLAGQLASVLLSRKEEFQSLPRPDMAVVRILQDWLAPRNGDTSSPSPSMSTVSCPEYGELQDKLQRLEMDRESLSLQVSVLTEQVGAQTEKIKDLESMLEDKRQKLDSTEDMLQEPYVKELGARTTLETSKLDLMAQISSLRLKLAEFEREKMDTESKLKSSKVEIEQLHRQMKSQDSYAKSALNQRQQQGTVDQAGEIEQLRCAVQQLMVANVEKEDEIEKLKGVVVAQARTANYGGGWEETVGVPRSVSAYAGMGNGNIPPEFDINQQLRKLLSEEVSARVNYPFYPATTYASYTGPSVQSSSSYNSSLSALSTGSPLTLSGPTTPRHQQFLPPTGSGRPPLSSLAARQLAAELDELAPNISARRPPQPATSCATAAYYATGSLPRNISTNQTPPLPKKNRKLSSGEWSRSKAPRVPFKGLKWLHKQLRPSKRSTSAPNLGNLDGLRSNCNLTESDEDEDTLESAKAFNEKFKRDKKQKSFRNLLGKLKRSNSQELRDPDFGDGSGFRRGVLTRATTAPRMGIGWTTSASQHLPIRPPIDQFYSWGPEQVCDWLTELGLNMYVGEARRVVQSGRHLTVMNQQEMEKELGMKNPLHRKKLNLAIAALELARPEAYDRMDNHQVLRWLDDIGLPQYRDAFAEARVDGQMLNALTVDDLLQMKITSAIHHAALARGIQVLRNISFNINRLQRKFSQELNSGGACPNAVQLWTQHCVSEWLRTIDLAEFTPNLMCAGIHGALIVLEPCFTAESLAEVLRMPPQKTLLRRHLTTHFNQLLGNEIVAAKRQVLSQPFVLRLNPELKVKPLKKGFSLSRKKGKTEVYLEPDELVCPLNPSRPPPSSGLMDMDISVSM